MTDENNEVNTGETKGPDGENSEASTGENSETATDENVGAAAEERPEATIDEDATGKFVAMGYKEPLPKTLVAFYREFKRRQDLIRPARVGADGCAFISLLADLTVGDINIDGS